MGKWYDCPCPQREEKAGDLSPVPRRVSGSPSILHKSWAGRGGGASDGEGEGRGREQLPVFLTPVGALTIRPGGFYLLKKFMSAF